jgi:hypothetical protein
MNAFFLANKSWNCAPVARRSHSARSGKFCELGCAGRVIEHSRCCGIVHVLPALSSIGSSLLFSFHSNTQVVLRIWKLQSHRMSGLRAWQDRVKLFKCEIRLRLPVRPFAENASKSKHRRGTERSASVRGFGDRQGIR